MSKDLKEVNTSRRRIGVSEKEIVILDRTSSGKYHGHVRTWKELKEHMQRALLRAKLATKSGKII